MDGCSSDTVWLWGVYKPGLITSTHTQKHAVLEKVRGNNFLLSV